MKLDSNKVTVLVTDGNNRSSLAVTRSLGRHGCRVIVSCKSENSIASKSRFCDVYYKVTDPIKNQISFLHDIINIVNKERINFIYPMTEATIIILEKNKLLLPKNVVLAAPSINKIKTIFNKFELFQLAGEIGIPIPETIFINNRNDFFKQKPVIKKFPVVIKPSLSIRSFQNGFFQTKVSYAKNYHDLSLQYKKNRALDFPSMIQEKIIGPGTGLFSLFDKNRHLALFSHERIREKPPSGGVSVISRSIPLDDNMVVAAEKLLSTVGWEGVAMVEFKRDIRDGKAKLMEINGRFWGTLQLAIWAGVDFPVLLLNYLQKGSNIPFHNRYLEGVQMRWLIGTLDNLLIRLKNKEERILSQDAISLIESCKYPYEKKRKTTFDVFRHDDIKPFIFEIREYFQSIFCKIFQI